MKRGVSAFALLCTTALCTYPALAEKKQDADSSRNLTVDRIFNTPEFESKGYGPVQWSADGASYTLLEPAQSPNRGQDLVRYDRYRPGT